MATVISLAEFRQAVSRKQGQKTLNYTDADFAEIFGKNVTVWRNDGQDEIHRKAAVLGFYTREEFERFVARMRVLANALISDAVEAVTITNGFPVFEVEDRSDGNPIYLYIARAGGKACILNVTSSRERKSSIERALRWISLCQHREQHGSPTLVDLYGDTIAV